MAASDPNRPLVTAGEKLDDDFRSWRDRKLADPAFRRWASAQPFTRLIASRSAQKLFDLTAGFVYSQILKACVDLKLFDTLAQGPRTADEVAAASALSPAAASRLLDAAVGLELVERRRDGRYGLGLLGAALNGEPGVKAMIAHHDMLYADLADPVALLRGETETRLSAFWPYAGGGGAAAHPAPGHDGVGNEGAGQEPPRAEGHLAPPRADDHDAAPRTDDFRTAPLAPGAAPPAEGGVRAPGGGSASARLGDAAVADYSELMNESQSFVAEDVLDLFSFGDRNALLDVGGGEGAFAAAAARRWPHLKIGLFELPAVAARAERRLDAQGLGDRVLVEGGDMFADPPPAGFDVISLVRVLHDHDDDRALTLLRNVHAALAPQGELLIAEPIAGMAGAERVGAPYFGFYLLAMGSGRPRDAGRIAALLEHAGFVKVRTRLTRGALPLAVITARRAGEGPVWRI